MLWVICSNTGYSAQKCVSQTGKPSLPAKNCSDTGFSLQKGVSRTTTRHYPQNSAATQDIRHKSVYREQKNRHYRQNSAATQTFRFIIVCRERRHRDFRPNERWHGTPTHLGRFEGHNRPRYDVFPAKITNSFTPRSFFCPKTSKVH